MSDKPENQAAETELTHRQGEILRGVVEAFVATGEPVGSRTLVDRAGLDVSPSTVRAELAELEARGLLTHPHTSAGRIPTEHGYRYYADRLLERLERLGLVRHERRESLALTGRGRYLGGGVTAELLA